MYCSRTISVDLYQFLYNLGRNARIANDSRTRNINDDLKREEKVAIFKNGHNTEEGSVHILF